MPGNAPEDPAARLDAVVRAFTKIILETEAQQRTMLRLSLEEDPKDAGSLPLRQGRAIGRFEEAFAPPHTRLSGPEAHQLAALAVRSAVGIEALAWLTDVAGLTREEAVRTVSWSAQALLHAALTWQPPEPTLPHRWRSQAKGND